MAKQGKLVRQDADGIWLAAALAAEKSGLTKPELARRALAGELAFQGDKFGRPVWFAEPQIIALARERHEAELAKAAKPKRKLTDAQLEAQHTRQWQADIDREKRNRTREGPFAGSLHRGPLAEHAERVMLGEIAAANKKRQSDTD